jgi:arsenate reductase
MYGIPNCDSCKKARRWLESRDVEYHFHDLRVDGLDRTMIGRWYVTAEWKRLLNTRSTTWRNLPDEQKIGVDADGALELMLTNPTLVKRPVLEHATGIEVGFSAARYEEIVG